MYVKRNKDIRVKLLRDFKQLQSSLNYSVDYFVWNS
jgi:hypothetical protein